MISRMHVAALLPAELLGRPWPRTAPEADALVRELNADARRTREQAAAKHAQRASASVLRARQAAPSAPRRCAPRGETVFALFERRERERLQLLAARGGR